MKFDYCIGNPPYQKNMQNTSDVPVYNDFMDVAYTIADKVELITPARFLFDAGKTPKNWNHKMLNDEHFKVMNYEISSKNVFANTDIKGGIAIHYRDITKDFGTIGSFVIFKELQTIKDKVAPTIIDDLSSIMYQQNRFNLDVLYQDHSEVKKFISSDGTEQRIISNYFMQMENIVFYDKPFKNSLAILGIINNNQRIYKYIDKKYVQNNDILYKYKVLVPFANGSGALGEVLSTPLIGTPLIGYTKSFIGVGLFDTESEANNCLKYIKTKFARVMLGILKNTQGNAPKTWKYVPLQDFTSNSDIDWSQSISDIDKQLYQKYNLSDDEINFIETHVKEMN